MLQLHFKNNWFSKTQTNVDSDSVLLARTNVAKVPNSNFETDEIAPRLLSESGLTSFSQRVVTLVQLDKVHVQVELQGLK